MTTRDEARAARLWYWNRLFHGVPVCIDELTPRVLCADEVSAEESMAFVLLRSCATLAGSMRASARHALRIAVLYWFSNVGTRRGVGRGPLYPKRSTFHLGEVVGTGFTWDEAVAVMGCRPIDFSAYLWLLEVVEAEVARQWALAFPTRAPAGLTWPRANDKDVHAPPL